MATSLVFLLFATLIVVGAFTMAKIQRAELAEARAKRNDREERLKAYRAKCYRPDGD